MRFITSTYSCPSIFTPSNAFRSPNCLHPTHETFTHLRCDNDYLSSWINVSPAIRSLSIHRLTDFLNSSRQRGRSQQASRRPTDSRFTRGLEAYAGVTRLRRPRLSHVQEMPAGTRRPHPALVVRDRLLSRSPVHQSISGN